MGFYSKYVLPRYLDGVMRNKDLEQYREVVCSCVAGTGLEIGFGSGLNLPHYRNVNRLYALDPSKELYELAKTNIESVPFSITYLEQPAELISLPDNSLDFVVSTWNLCTIAEPDKALREIFRVLKPNGKFSFIEHGKSPRPWISKTQKILTPISVMIAGGCHLDRDIERLILNAGFEISKLKKFSLRSKPLGFMYQGQATANK